MNRLPHIAILFLLCIAGCESQPSVEQKTAAENKPIAESKSKTNTEKKEAAKPTGQNTPQATFEKGTMSLMRGDYTSFASTVYQGPSASRAMYDAYTKSRALRDALNTTFGEGAWEKFNKIEGGGFSRDLTNMYAEIDVVKAAIKKGIKFEVDGDVATCIVPWNGRFQRLRKATNGAWYVDMGAPTKGAASIFSAVNVGIDAVMKNITKKGITMKELRRAQEQATEKYYRTEGIGKN